ncbi:hypothetical protein HK096_010356, partial [Nowakowskiella sp. JEL0078]
MLQCRFGHSKPSLKNLRVFGSDASIFINNLQHEGKFYPKAHFSVFVGLELNEVALFYVPDTNCIISASSFSINEGVFTRSQNHQFVDPFYFEEPRIQILLLLQTMNMLICKDQNDSDDEQVDPIKHVHKTNFHGVLLASNFGQSNNFDDIITISDDPSLDKVEVLGENTVQDSEIQLKSEPSGSEYIN